MDITRFDHRDCDYFPANFTNPHKDLHSHDDRADLRDRGNLVDRGGDLAISLTGWLGLVLIIAILPLTTASYQTYAPEVRKNLKNMRITVKSAKHLTILGILSVTAVHNTTAEYMTVHIKAMPGKTVELNCKAGASFPDRGSAYNWAAERGHSRLKQENKQVVYIRTDKSDNRIRCRKTMGDLEESQTFHIITVFNHTQELQATDNSYEKLDYVTGFLCGSENTRKIQEVSLSHVATCSEEDFSSYKLRNYSNHDGQFEIFSEQRTIEFGSLRCSISGSVVVSACTLDTDGKYRGKSSFETFRGDLPISAEECRIAHTQGKLNTTIGQEYILVDG